MSQGDVESVCCAEVEVFAAQASIGVEGVRLPDRRIVFSKEAEEHYDENCPKSEAVLFAAELLHRLRSEERAMPDRQELHCDLLFKLPLFVGE